MSDEQYKNAPSLDMFKRQQTNQASAPINSQDLYKVIETALLANVIEQRRGRRWGIFFKILGFSYLIVILLAMFVPFISNKPSVDMLDEYGNQYKSHTAVIKLTGTIASSEDASAERLIRSLNRAFLDPETAAIVIEINSGGGSPVQSGYVYDEIKRLRGEYTDTKVYAVITDVGASGAYYIAAAADEIYADKASLVGSIGVTAASFGFVDTMAKLGVERRLYTSGSHKAFLDPFMPMNATETDFWKVQLGVVHNQFISVVRAGRGNRLKETPDMFSGLIWSGEEALKMGLIDGLSSTRALARDVIKSPKMKNFNVEDNQLDKLIKKMGLSIGQAISTQMGLTPGLR
ncbi:peptidase [Gammaproteobacteria bacterium]|nr:peptidase [Gammaproteobacteria bacterium]